ncbi:PREDICTED: sushi domain-containing protein 4-like isoform X2 [Nicrophorus vespilloides]|uniref:Sushi domain-containing protein 4-like isoform X2 n=1 Tax=Nicrophorus vespilloides TaxID=110193 RepID=A0ABM1NDN6_NICVS|nr:PREDICTED: sushi domain-containing protein 4-like isoform X2 [Nicrophorus vespilloides]
MIPLFSCLVLCYFAQFSTANDLDLNNNIIPKCPDFSFIQNGRVNQLSSAPLGFEVVCNENHELVGQSKVFCRDGKWDYSRKPKCMRKCNEPPRIMYGHVVEIDSDSDSKGFYKPGTVATYDCYDGYLLSPPKGQYQVCEMGYWLGTNFSCVYEERVRNCKQLKEIKNGYYEHPKIEYLDDFAVGQSVKYVCNSGYIMKGNNTQKCEPDGNWSPRTPPICVANDESQMRCPKPPTYPHSVTKDLSSFQNIAAPLSGTEIEVFCISKYRNTNSPCQASRMKCIAGQWKGIPPNCEPVSGCPCPPKVYFGSPFLLTPSELDMKICNYPMRSQISYICLPGYELEGESILTCSADGCWGPSEAPVCKLKQRYYYLEANGGEPIVFSLATGAGVLLLLVVACLIIVCRKRKPLSRSVAIPPPVPRPDLADHASLLHPPDRLALIAFADGMQVGQSGLPTYEEATRDRNLGIPNSRIHRPPWPSLVGRRSRNSPNPENMLFTRQGSFASHSASTRSGGDPMGSTDTMAVSENSTTVTLDTASSHSGSQPASCRAHCGSLASFDTNSVLNTEGVPLLEESELEEIQCGDTVSLAMENRSMCDNTSYKLSTASDLA